MILVTGGLGFLGGRISSRLLQSGKSVRIGSSRNHPAVPAELSTCEVVQIDLEDESSLVEACNGVTTIIHLAAANAQESEASYEQALQINGLGTLKLLNAARICSVKKIIYFSTIHVYGNPLNGLIDEDRTPQPSSSYAITHRLAEDYVLNCNETDDLSTVVLRLANVVGLPLNEYNKGWDLVVNNLCRQAIIDKEIRLLSKGLQNRNFVSIEDVLQIVAILVDTDFKSLPNRTFNVGGKTLSIAQVAKEIAKQCGALFSYIPPIVTGEIDEIESDFEFDYSRVKSLGYSQSEVSNEIKKLLMNLKKNIINDDV